MFGLLNIVRVVHAQSLAECLTVAHGVMTSHSLVSSPRAASSDHATELLLYTNICPDTHLPSPRPSPVFPELSQVAARNTVGE